MTDDDIIKALENCSDGTNKGIIKATLSLIKLQKTTIDILIREHDDLLDELAEKQAEIERLEEDNRGFSICLDSAVKTALEIKSEAMKEFANKFEEMLNEINFPKHPYVDKTLNICKNISKIILATLTKQKNEIYRVDKKEVRGDGLH